ncbi:MAG: polyphosphate kinase 1 [Limnospira sp. PMC 1291.21]|uniref:Polyphosphate kinase n=3 Tax=Limnospira TaxID=2596745 RepID=A0A9P1KE04_9CYAN|nr:MULTISPECIES: polyphosphate kinase 1 [Limnospira]AMW28909.1 polyphosphate kinase [Arthrospira platensis YZ]EKD11693.1 polyphosphate kinase [Arthrospira platensis C1]MBD2670673.1 polyphosphate kinase 1 [Arthrospira platensis FACHB-439]MDY7053780.1 polyphosphate kinase 1 [Limnospira fusiformis LS22]QJB27281.1 polyphosphate kinase 1 [Limnospira fusiformis SAG 85.79]
MAKSKKTDNSTSVKIDMKDPQYFFNRELSWLEFNRRVLAEALDPRTPLLERLKFMAIFSSNLDEFFMVRVAGLKRQMEAHVNKRTPDGRTPRQQLTEIHEKLLPMVSEQHNVFDKIIKPELGQHNIHLLNYIDLNQEQRNYLHEYFESQIFPVLTPLAIDRSHPFPYLSNLSLNLVVVLKNPETNEDLLARIKVPKLLPRFIAIPDQFQKREESESCFWAGVPIEQLIAHNLESLFPGMNILDYYPFRITRDADLSVQEDEGDDLLLAIEQELRKRRLGGSVVRLEVNTAMPEYIRDMLMEELEIDPEDIYSLDGLLDLKDLMSFIGLPIPELKDPDWTPALPKWLADSDETTCSSNGELEKDIFAIIRQGDVLVHHPYQSFSATVQQFITQAADDPNVLAIKMTLYRTSGDSPIINALIAAAENGKQVAALVELKARFDEENNIHWARKLEQRGVHVVYGVVGLKTHTKIVMVVRHEEGHIRRYVHIGTGNYNPKTAKLYTDLGLFSCREELGEDLTDLFNFLTGYSRQQSYRKLLVAPVNMRDRFLGLIRREIDNCNAGKTGRIVAKMNSLVDPEIIATLYEASMAGVTIDLIVRGICCLRPGVKGISENINVISIVGRFLEHSRIFYFHNHGEEEVYIGSADWMPRNLNRRVEAIAPVEDPKIVKDLQEILGIMLSDNRHAWDLQSDGIYIQRQPADKAPELSAQTIFMETAETGK